MRRYFRLLYFLAKNNLAREFEFRSYLVIRWLTDLIWVALQLILIVVFFSFSPQILGWNRYEIFMFTGLFRVIKGVFDTFARRNIHYLPENINRGDLDYALTRPVNSLFLMSFRYHALGETSSVVSGFIIFIWAFSQLGSGIGLIQIVSLLVLIITGVIILYCLVLGFAILSFFTTRLTALSSYYEVLSNTLRFPTDIYHRYHPLLDVILLPLVFAVTFPTKIFLNRLPAAFLFLQILAAAITLFLVYRFWRFALRHYSSASS
ncbi:hypothetical protein A2395_01660 [Candidatus Amesbacteria bacterium RIFOXYB1_FULL_47_9]|uniref:ABC transporter permease n=1 Tax=Candidatus Amesbacteria bacterium RIFOXYB1_FULL_47_9 TaxID=1797266 RepID=A0A1F4ZRK0_9BACT|nr:MAG: hypothetical protein A2395_01660 [Candidatus Amesbacteria bacterium RIFOXYB1_FULL_47_9]